MDIQDFEKYCTILMMEQPEIIDMWKRSPDHMLQAYALLIQDYAGTKKHAKTIHPYSGGSA